MGHEWTRRFAQLELSAPAIRGRDLNALSVGTWRFPRKGHNKCLVTREKSVNCPVSTPQLCTQNGHRNQDLCFATTRKSLLKSRSGTTAYKTNDPMDIQVSRESANPFRSRPVTEVFADDGFLSRAEHADLACTSSRFIIPTFTKLASEPCLGRRQVHSATSAASLLLFDATMMFSRIITVLCSRLSLLHRFAALWIRARLGYSLLSREARIRHRKRRVDAPASRASGLQQLDSVLLFSGRLHEVAVVNSTCLRRDGTTPHGNLLQTWPF